MKIVLYMREADAADFRAEGIDPAEWVRELVKRAIERKREERVTKT